MIIRASGSSRRQELLRRHAVDFQVCVTNAKESSDSTDIRKTLLNNALNKARSAAELHPEHWVLGCDTAIIFDNRIFGKPQDLADAHKMLMTFSGQKHEVSTACAIVRKGEAGLITAAAFIEKSEVFFKTLTPETVEAYCREVNVLDKAGSYAIQESGSKIIEYYTGSLDNIIGLPCRRVLQVLSILPSI